MSEKEPAEIVKRQILLRVTKKKKQGSFSYVLNGRGTSKSKEELVENQLLTMFTYMTKINMYTIFANFIRKCWLKSSFA